MRRSSRVPLARTILAATLVVALVLVGCSSGNTSSTTPASTSELILSSTTSTQDSGLFDVLIPAFETAYPEYKVKVIAVGTGEALKLGETKDADVMLVHSKPDEEKSVAEGWAPAASTSCTTTSSSWVLRRTRLASKARQAPPRRWPRSSRRQGGQGPVRVARR